MEQISMFNQYMIDIARFTELFCKFTGISNRKVAYFLEENTVDTLFNHPTALDITPAQLQKVNELKELKGLYENLKLYKQEYVMNNPDKAGDYLKNYFINTRDKERFICAFLDNSLRVIAVKCMSEGTVSFAGVYPREIAKEALMYNASSVVLAHNHPGGSKYPSNEDIEITKTITAALKTLGINVVDHIIVTDSDYSSMKNMGIDFYCGQNGNCVREKIIMQYSKEFPAIKYISEETAQAINSYNEKIGGISTLREIKEEYMRIGERLEREKNKEEDLKTFKELQYVVDDLKKAQLIEKQEMAKSVSTRDINMPELE